MSRVVNVRKAELNKLGYKDLEDWLNASPNHVYIGRNMTHYVKGAVGSKWANPFKVDQGGREECVNKYEMYVRTNHLLLESLNELEGKVLGCWCHPEKCHGDVLIKLLSEKQNDKN